jgi:hypothetical protein
MARPGHAMRLEPRRRGVKLSVGRSQSATPHDCDRTGDTLAKGVLVVAPCLIMFVPPTRGLRACRRRPSYS